VPEHDHPDHEQLAAFQAGDGDRRQRAEVEAHLAGCPSCAEMVASVGQARSRLALLEEPSLPPGLHDRLAAAVEEEAARATPDGQAPWYRRRPAARPTPGYPRRRAERPTARPTPWYRRPVAWGAAAALLLAALVVPFLDRSGGNPTTAGGGSTDSAKEAATASSAARAGGVPVLRIPGEVTAAKLRAELAAGGQAKAALDSAASGAQAAPRADQGAGPATQSPAQGDGDRYGPSSPAPQAGPSSAPAPQADAATLGPCLTAATAAADPAIAPLRPAFFVQGTYQGREATILVTTSAGQPGRVDLWVFPRDNCSAPPLDSERVR
jgi:type II secretory pathway pseudopilin PulG